MDAVDFAGPNAHQDDGRAGTAGTSRPIGMTCRGKQKFMAAQTTGPGSKQPTINDVAALAGWADFLVIATPGGPDTKHLVNAAVLDALGPQGVVVNIARGSVIDTAALAAALREGRIAAAGLDVYESEPAPPAELLDLDNVVLTPHVAGWSPEAVQNSVDLTATVGRSAGRLPPSAHAPPTAGSAEPISTACLAPAPDAMSGGREASRPASDRRRTRGRRWSPARRRPTRA